MGVGRGVVMGEGRDVAIGEGSAPDRRAQAPMTSPVNWALLGLIIDRPSYAYELAQRFERAYLGVLSLSSTSHVYTALGALASRSLIEEIAGTHGGRQPKPRYQATARGGEEYRDWLVGQLAEDRRRQRLFVLELAALTRNPAAARDVIDRYEEACHTEASMIPIPALDGAPLNGSSDFIVRVLSEENRLAVGAKLSWVQYMRRELTALTDGRAGDKPARARRQALPERATRARRAA
jgi:DNA-binding PadR family transcriptional regulator